MASLAASGRGCCFSSLMTRVDLTLLGAGSRARTCGDESPLPDKVPLKPLAIDRHGAEQAMG